MDCSALLIFSGALLVAAGSPGPSVAALVSRAPNHTAGWSGSQGMRSRGPVAVAKRSRGRAGA